MISLFIIASSNEGGWLFDSTPFYGGQIRKAGSTFVADRFATDHLGSVRALVRNGQVLEQNDFYPYGMRHANISLIATLSNRWRFSAKEIQTTAGINLLDFGARLYDDRICRWTSQDPLAAKYPAFSPYAYCAGDPVGVMDNDGAKLYFAKGSSESFKKSFADAVKIMNEKGTSYNLAKLEDSSLNFYIQESNLINSFRVDKDKGTLTILWNPSRLLEDKETGHLISPLTLLAHEASHANGYREAAENNDVKSFEDYYNTKVANYDNLEERRVITTDEQIAARRHGEITENQVTRKSPSNNDSIIINKPLNVILDLVRRRNLNNPF